MEEPEHNPYSILPLQILPAEGFITNRRNGCVKLRREEAGLGSEEPISIPTMLKDISEAYPEVRKELMITQGDQADLSQVIASSCSCVVQAW